MKTNRHDQAKVLTPDEISRLFSEGLTQPRDRSLFGICLYTACCINEACSLYTADVFSARGEVRERITFRRKSTKGQQSTRSIPVSPELQENYWCIIRAAIFICFPADMVGGILTRDRRMRFYGRRSANWELKGQRRIALDALPLPRCTMPESRLSIFKRFQGIRPWQIYNGTLR